MSPVISNLVLKSFDAEIKSLALKYGCECTRYADDICFSTDSSNFNREKAQQLIGEVFKVIYKNGLKPNNKKTTIVPPGAKKIVTGLIVNKSKPRLTKDFKQNLETHLHFAEKYGVLSHIKKRDFNSTSGFRSHLWGLIQFANSIEKDFGEDCKAKFETLDWEKAELFPDDKPSYWL